MWRFCLRHSGVVVLRELAGLKIDLCNRLPGFQLAGVESS